MPEKAQRKEKAMGTDAVKFESQVTVSASCGGCTTRSQPLTHTTAAKAKQLLKTGGWLIRHHRGGKLTVRCPECQQNEQNEKAAKARRLKEIAEDRKAFLRDNRAARKATLGQGSASKGPQRRMPGPNTKPMFSGKVASDASSPSPK